MSETKPDLRVVPKPEGFELREARSRKLQDGAKWEAMDVLHAASKQIADAGGKVTSCVVVWSEECKEENSRDVMYRSCGPADERKAILMNLFGRMMGWR